MDEKNLEECFKIMNDGVTGKQINFCKNKDVELIYKDMLKMLDCTDNKTCSIDKFKENHDNVNTNYYYNSIIIARNLARSTMADYMNISAPKKLDPFTKQYCDITSIIWGFNSTLIKFYGIDEYSRLFERIDQHTNLFIESGCYTIELAKPQNNGLEKHTLLRNKTLIPYCEKYKCERLTNNLDECHMIAYEIEKLLDSKLPLPEEYKRLSWTIHDSHL